MEFLDKYKKIIDTKRARNLKRNCKYILYKNGTLHYSNIKLWAGIFNSKNHSKIGWEICVPILWWLKIISQVENVYMFSWNQSHLPRRHQAPTCTLGPPLRPCGRARNSDVQYAPHRISCQLQSQFTPSPLGPHSPSGRSHPYHSTCITNKYPSICQSLSQRRFWIQLDPSGATRNQSPLFWWPHK